MKSPVTLVGDGIENPANALTMFHAAEMFGVACRFRDTKGLARAETPHSGETVTGDQLRTLHPRRIAFDNLPGAKDVYGYQAGSDFAVLVGNERRGLSHEFASLATEAVQAPMISRRINCLNVAAASAVALYYLCGGRSGPMASHPDPAGRRPELLFLNPRNHFELGSAIRSAAAFGWPRAWAEDREQIWFGCDRKLRSEGRAAARRGRNEILLIPSAAQARLGFARVTVVTCRRNAPPLHRVNLARGSGQLVVIPDESEPELPEEDWSRLGAAIELASVPIPAADFVYHYRLLATIALAEISRQVGRRPLDKVRPPPTRRPTYDLKAAPPVEALGEWVQLDELLDY